METASKPQLPFSTTTPITLENVVDMTNNLYKLIKNNTLNYNNKDNNDTNNNNKLHAVIQQNEENNNNNHLLNNNNIQYLSDTDANYIDRNVFDTTCSKFTQEADSMAKISYMIEEAEEYASVLYTWRSCTIPLPKSMTAEGANVSIQLIEKEIEKLKNFYLFQREAVELYRNEVIRLVNAATDYTNSDNLLMFVRMTSKLSTLDELKNIKASIKNDFAHYKRVMGKRSISHEQVDQLRDISLFLASHNAISSKVKEVMTVASGYQDLFCHVINLCVSRYEGRLYLLPEEKYDLVKVIGFLLFMLDGPQCNINKSKKINLSKIDAVFKEVEVIPLYGDMVFSAFNYIHKTTNFDASHWPKCMSTEPSSQSSLVGQMTQFRQQHTNLVMDFVLAINLIDPKNYASQGPASTNKPATLEQMSAASCIAFKCFHALSTWTCAILEMVSWKITHPAELKRANFPGCPVEATDFERVTKYNYSDQDKTILVEMIGFINDIKKLLNSNLEVIFRHVLNHIFNQLQTFLNIGLSEPIRKANKHHKDLLHSLLMAIQCTSVDTASLIQIEIEGKKSKKAAETYAIKTKFAKMSQCQLYLVKSISEYLVDKSNSKNPGKDLDGHHAKVIKEFLNQSVHWMYAIKLEDTLKRSCDLSQLWYREFYLEMTKGEEIQFPIEQSLIWILTSFILDEKDAYLTHFLMCVFDLYNDSANCAVYTFKKQHLFAEIEAEALLCFEQLVYKLSERVYESYRTKASMITLNKRFKRTCKEAGFDSSRVEYLKMLLFKNIQLLGRSVDLKMRMTKSMHDFLLKSLNAAITRFESGDVKGVVELNTLIEVTKETHKLLSKHLNLDDFQSLWQEANHNITSSYGRVSIYILLELTSDFFPHYCYNSSTGRFVYTVLPFAETTTRDKPPNHPAYLLWGNKVLAHHFSTILAAYSNFFGSPHLYAILDLLGYQDVAMLTKELLENLKTLLRNTLLPYITSLQAVMPEKSMLPSYDYTSPGILGYYEIQLEGILTYSDLQPKVFQCLREVGNTVLFLMLVEQHQTIRECMEYNMSTIFLKILPKPFIKDDSTEQSFEVRRAERDKFEKSMDLKYRFQHIYPVMAKNATPEQFAICKDNYLLTKDKLSLGLNSFPTFLKMFKSDLEQINRLVFYGNSDKSQSQDITNTETIKKPKTKLDNAGEMTSSVWSVERNGEFHRLWSAMQFVMSRTQGKNELTVEQLFGEGLNWGGCSLVYLLGQELRFQAMDPSYHLYNVNRADQIDKMCAGVNLRKMVDRIRKFQILNDQIFACLAKHYHSNNESFDDGIQNLNKNNDNKIYNINNSKNNNNAIIDYIPPIISIEADLPITIIDKKANAK